MSSTQHLADSLNTCQYGSEQINLKRNALKQTNDALLDLIFGENTAYLTLARFPYFPLPVKGVVATFLRVLKLSVLELNENHNGLLSKVTRKWCCVF